MNLQPGDTLGRDQEATISQVLKTVKLNETMTKKIMNKKIKKVIQNRTESFERQIYNILKNVNMNHGLR